MKNLTIEEKSKAYDKALERAKEKYPTCYAPTLLEYIFPELKESEDEKIRIALISILKSDFEKDTTIFGIRVGEIIAWLEEKNNKSVNLKKLEKQGEQEFIDSDTLIQQRVDTLADIDAKQSSADNVKPKVKNEIEIPFGAKDSELQEAIYYIPKGFYAEINGDKVVIKKGEKPTAWNEENERIRKLLIHLIKTVYDNTNYLTYAAYKGLLTWLEKLDDNIKL